MDLQKIAREIGLLETAINLSRYRENESVLDKSGYSMPIPNDDIEKHLNRIAEWLIGFGKRKYLLITPEIALIDKLGELSTEKPEIILVLPCNLESDMYERITNNLPQNADITILDEPYFPKDFFPGNGLIVSCGYVGGERKMVLPETYRMIEHYSSFCGKNVFIPYTVTESGFRYNGWMEVNQQRFTSQWEKENGHQIKLYK